MSDSYLQMTVTSCLFISSGLTNSQSVRMPHRKKESVVMLPSRGQRGPLHGVNYVLECYASIPAQSTTSGWLQRNIGLSSSPHIGEDTQLLVREGLHASAPASLPIDNVLRVFPMFIKNSLQAPTCTGTEYSTAIFLLSFPSKKWAPFCT